MLTAAFMECAVADDWLRDDRSSRRSLLSDRLPQSASVPGALVDRNLAPISTLSPLDDRWLDDRMSVLFIRGQDPASNGAGGAAEEEGPAHIRDNAFLVEEAFNQDAGVVQNIFNWTNTFDRIPGGRTRDFLFAHTMELPLGLQTHQFSFTSQFLGAFEKPDGGPAMNQGGVGDTFLNYRYQLLADDDFLWIAPRFSLIIPTGDERFGLGTGELGYQFNLPISRYGENFDFHFNAGVTYVPDVSAPLAAGGTSLGQNLCGYNLGGSAFWKPQTYLHFFVETLALWNDEIDEIGSRDHTTQVLINPGVRYAVIQLDEIEWVLGVSVPIGLTRESPDIGVFAYMSIEHVFLKK
jgi:hypothetical protein